MATPMRRGVMLPGTSMKSGTPSRVGIRLPFPFAERTDYAASAPATLAELFGWHRDKEKAKQIISLVDAAVRDG